MRPVRFRPRADRDVDLAIAYLLDESPTLAVQFLRELEAAATRIAERPAIGSPRYAYLLKGLRVWRLKRFNYLVFYLRRATHVDVIRVLHGARDIPQALRDAQAGK